MCVCIYIYIYIYVCKCTHTHIHTHTHTHAHTGAIGRAVEHQGGECSFHKRNIYVYIHIHMYTKYIRIYTYTHVHLSFSLSHTHIHIHTHLQSVGQRSIKAESAAIIYAMDPVYAAGFSYLLLDERLGAQVFQCFFVGLLTRVCRSPVIWFRYGSATCCSINVWASR